MKKIGLVAMKPHHIRYVTFVAPKLRSTPMPKNDAPIVPTQSALPDYQDASAVDPSELLKYEKYVAEMADLADGRVILNHTPGHAEIILAQIFRSARRNVNILTGELDDSVYGSPRVCDAVTDFLKRSPDASISILSEKDVIENHRLLSQVTSSGFADRIQMKKLDAGLEITSHFAVADGSHLRFEADKNHCEAIVMFGDKKIGARLDKLFGSTSAVAH